MTLFPAIFCLSLSSCFSYGLPEPLAGYAQTAKTLSGGVNPPTLAMITTKTTTGSDPEEVRSDSSSTTHQRDFLGSQYFFGLVPLTSLYFEHGNQYLVEELALDKLSSAGNRVLSGQAESLARSIKNTSIEHVVKPTLVSLSANAWDLFLTRRISVRGEVQVEFFEPDLDGNLVLRERTYSKIDFVKYKSQAQGASLAALIHKAVAGAIDHCFELRNFRPNPRAFKRLRKISREQRLKDQDLIYVSQPQIPEELAEALTREITDSYGFPNWPAYSTSQLARTLQRGFVNGLTDVSLSPISVVGLQGNNVSGRNLLNKTLKTKVKHIELNSENHTLAIEIDWDILSSASSEASSTGSCNTKVRADRKRDGAWVFALEDSSATLAQEIFALENSFTEKLQSGDTTSNILSLSCRRT